MKRILAAVLLAASVPAVAQVVGTEAQTADIAAAAKAARELGRKLAPAKIDADAVDALTNKLIKDGDQIRTETGELGNALTRRGEPDARGRFRDIEANLIEAPASEVEPPQQGMIRDLVMRRYFKRLEATSDEWTVGKDGTGRVDEWHYTISLDGRLMSVEHAIVPIEVVGPGLSGLVEAKGRAYRMSPSDPSVQRRWKKFSKELLTLGRLYSA